MLIEEIGLNSSIWRLLMMNCLISLLPYSVAPRLRTMLYRLGGIRIGPRTIIHGKLSLLSSRARCRNLRIGRSCRVNAPCRIGLDAAVTLGDRVVIGYGVTIITASHRFDDPTFRAGEPITKPVSIGDGAWIAANATILPGVSIGEGAVIGAASVVTQDVPPHTLYAGNPAHFVRHLPTLQ